MYIPLDEIIDVMLAGTNGVILSIPLSLEGSSLDSSGGEPSFS